MATFEGTLLDEPTSSGARVVALGLLDDVARERERLRAPDRDPEALHDFRVAVRRFRSWIRALQPVLEGSLPEGAARKLRRIAKDSNASRDAEVLVGWLATASKTLARKERGTARWLAARFSRQQREADASLEARMEQGFDAARRRLARRLETFQLTVNVHDGLREVPLASTVARYLREHAEVLGQRLAGVRNAESERDAHRARLAGKRLRYLLEPVAPHVEGGVALVERLKALQDTLGDLHDAHLWLMILREVVAELAMEEGRQLARALMSGTEPPRAENAKDDRPTHAGLTALARLAQERATSAYAQLKETWGPKETKAFFRDLEALCAALEARAGSGLEIERKYLLRRLPPDMPGATVERITQGYMPGRKFIERLRMVQRGRQRTYVRTVKIGTGLVRTELEEETTRAVFDALWPLTEGRRVSKRRHRVADGDLAWEVDEFTDRDLVLVEIELPSADTTVSLPDWLKPYVEREVTGDPAYLNANLAR